ncbi:MAG: protease HtpX [Chlamydiae bacterium]|nr:protease HtpX [Chlamydiota bacterium]
MFRRVGLFLILNFVIVFTISMILRIFNIQPYIQQYGLDLKSLALFCFIWGMMGAFISLLLSKTIAKWTLGVRVIDQNTSDYKLKYVYQVVKKQAHELGIPVPEVGIFETQLVNAFATGPSKSNSLVAVSRGLLNQLSEEEIEAVIGHEMSHIANGDMVTMTLMQGVVNAFVMFLARVLAFALSNAGRSKDDQRSGYNGSFYLFTFLFEMIFMILGSMVIAAYSRYREYRADFGGASLSSKRQMISALSTLEQVHDKALPEGAAKSLDAFMIRGGSMKFLTLFASHPPIAKRIERLNQHLELR